jgi:hypothetical protein
VSTLGVFCINNPQLGYGQISLWYLSFEVSFVYIYAYLSIYLSIYLLGVRGMDGLLLNLKVEIGNEVQKNPSLYYCNQPIFEQIPSF